MRFVRSGAALQRRQRWQHRCFSVIQRGHDRQRETLYEKLGFGKDSEARQLQRTVEELKQGFIAEAMKLRDPQHDPKDQARFEELQTALRILSNRVSRSAYDSHSQSSNDARLHVLQDGGAVSANYNPEFQQFNFVDHSIPLSASASGSSSSGGSIGGAEGAAGQGQTPVSSSFSDFSEAFHSAAGVASPAEARAAAAAAAPAKGSDIHFMLKLTFEEGLFGCEKRIAVRRNAPCDRCEGSGHQRLSKARRCPQCLGRGSTHLPSGTYNMERRCNFCDGSGTTPPPACKWCRGSGLQSGVAAEIPVVVPPRTEHMGTFRIAKQGHAGARGGRSGDVVVQTVVTDHRHFYLDERKELHAMLPIPLSTALLGGLVSAPTLSGTVTLRVPPCIRSGEVMTVPAASKGAAPPLHFHALVLIPKGPELSGRQRAALGLYEEITAAAATATAEADSAAPEATRGERVSSHSSSDMYEQCAELKQLYKHWFSM